MINAPVIPVIKFESSARPFLGRPVRFTVYSRHRSAVNLKIGRRLLPLLGEGASMGPSAIVLSSLDLFFTHDSGTVFFDGGEEVSLSCPENPDGKFLERIAPVICKKRKFLKGYDDAAVEEKVKGREWSGILGLGSGMTPKGDDFLLGYSLFSREKSFMYFFGSADFGSRTNLLASFFLEFARNKKVTQSVADFAEGRNARLLEEGASSGLYTAWGILEGCDIVVS